MSLHFRFVHPELASGRNGLGDADIFPRELKPNKTLNVQSRGSVDRVGCQELPSELQSQEYGILLGHTENMEDTDAYHTSYDTSTMGLHATFSISL